MTFWIPFSGPGALIPRPSVHMPRTAGVRDPAWAQRASRRLEDGSRAERELPYRFQLPFGLQLGPILDPKMSILCGRGCIFQEFIYFRFKAPKLAARGPERARRGSKRAPTGPERRPRRGQGGQEGLKEGPEWLQDGSKTAPSRCQVAASFFSLQEPRQGAPSHPPRPSLHPPPGP